MSTRFRTGLSLTILGLTISSTGCAASRSRLAACQSHVCQLQRQNRDICAQLDNVRAQNQELANKNLDAQDELARRDELLASLQRRAGEWGQERDEILRRSAALGSQSSSPLPRDLRSKLEQFAREHPDFVEVDAEAGISKFNTDVLFPRGKADLSPQSQQALSDFAGIFQSGSGRQMNIMVVGHTDKLAIKRPETRERFETNWDLSAARALSVQKTLVGSGVDPRRVGFSGFGEYQPVTSGSTEDSLSKNRRVEIYVLAPDAPIAGRTDHSRY